MNHIALLSQFWDYEGPFLSEWKELLKEKLEFGEKIFSVCIMQYVSNF